MRFLFSLALYGLLTLSVVFWCYVGFRIGKYPENHVGWNILWANGLFALLAIVALIHWFQDGGKFAIVVIVFCCISSIVATSFYYFDVLVPYETWLKRGMPERPF